jgi:hypothetical protein
MMMAAASQFPGTVLSKMGCFEGKVARERMPRVAALS